VVHGGERFTAATQLNPEVLRELEALNPLAPLHNPPALEAIHWLAALRPALPQWACFDTAFHATLPPEARTYALPGSWRPPGVRRYGFHGLNHQHLAEAAPYPRLITAHLGAGCSLAAIRDGISIDTTMGFTPLEGLVMASRSGSVDPGLLLHLQRQGLSLEQLERGLQQGSGLLGLSTGPGGVPASVAQGDRGHGRQPGGRGSDRPQRWHRRQRPAAAGGAARTDGLARDGALAADPGG
jgi:acetate kinase